MDCVRCKFFRGPGLGCNDDDPRYSDYCRYEIEGAQDEIEQLQAELKAARERIKELEGRNKFLRDTLKKRSGDGKK